MGKQILWGAGLVIGAIVVAAALWFFRPWSDYSPAGVIASRDAKDRAPIYRAMHEVYPYRVIEGAAAPKPIPRDIRELDIRYDYLGTERTLDAYAADFAITGLMLVRGGKVVHEQYWHGLEPEDQHTSWSVAKSIIATLIGVAVNEGRIESLDDPVEKYAAIYAGTDYGKTSVRHLMAMSSGIDFNENYEETGSDIRKLFFNTFLLHKDVDRFVRRYQQNRPAGQDFEYQSPNTTVLGAVLSGAYDGTTLSALAGEKLFQPNDMSEATWLLDRNAEDGKELAYCCVNMRLEDYAKFGLLYTNKKAANGARILPEGWGEFVGTPPATTHTDGAIAAGKQYYYGHHFWVPVDAKGAFFAAGYNGQFVWIDPERDIVLAMTSADTKYPGSNSEAHFLHRAAVDAVARLSGD